MTPAHSPPPKPRPQLSSTRSLNSPTSPLSAATMRRKQADQHDPAPTRVYLWMAPRSIREALRLYAAAFPHSDPRGAIVDFSAIDNRWHAANGGGSLGTFASEEEAAAAILSAPRRPRQKRLPRPEVPDALKAWWDLTDTASGFLRRGSAHGEPPTILRQAATRSLRESGAARASGQLSAKYDCARGTRMLRLRLIACPCGAGPP
jgi:hypothetical protein